MSWAQGIHTRENMNKQSIANLEEQCKRLTGEDDSFEYITWHEIDGSDAIAHFKSGRAFRLGSRKEAKA